jgi:hypothetical protein
MKIIKINENNPYREYLYDYLDWILEFGNNYLQFIFMKKVYLNNQKLYLPRWITQREMNNINKKTQNLIKKLDNQNEIR